MLQTKWLLPYKAEGYKPATVEILYNLQKEKLTSKLGKPLTNQLVSSIPDVWMNYSRCQATSAWGPAGTKWGVVVFVVCLSFSMQVFPADAQHGSSEQWIDRCIQQIITSTSPVDGLNASDYSGDLMVPGLAKDKPGLKGNLIPSFYSRK